MHSLTPHTAPSLTFNKILFSLDSEIGGGFNDPTESYDRNGSPTIMLVEDDAFDSLVVKRALVSLDVSYNVDWQQESWKAINKLINSPKNELPDLIFLDLKMPRIDGFQFLEELRSHPHLQKLPVVVVSTSSEKEDMEKAFSFGVKRYVVKSFDFNEFVDQLREFL